MHSPIPRMKTNCRFLDVNELNRTKVFDEMCNAECAMLNSAIQSFTPLNPRLWMPQSKAPYNTSSIILCCKNQSTWLYLGNDEERMDADETWKRMKIQNSEHGKSEKNFRKWKRWGRMIQLRSNEFLMLHSFHSAFLNLLLYMSLDPRWIPLKKKF